MFCFKTANSEKTQGSRLSVSASARVWKNFEEANVGVVVGTVAGVLLIAAVFLFLVVVHHRRRTCGRGSSSSLKLALFSHCKSLPLQLEPLTSSSNSKTESGMLYRSVAMSEIVDTERNVSSPGYLAKIDDDNYELHDASSLQASNYEILPAFPSPAQNQASL